MADGAAVVGKVPEPRCYGALKAAHDSRRPRSAHFSQRWSRAAGVVSGSGGGGGGELQHVRFLAFLPRGAAAVLAPRPPGPEPPHAGRQLRVLWLLGLPVPLPHPD